MCLWYRSKCSILLYFYRRRNLVRSRKNTSNYLWTISLRWRYANPSRTWRIYVAITFSSSFPNLSSNFLTEPPETYSRIISAKTSVKILCFHKNLFNLLNTFVLYLQRFRKNNISRYLYDEGFLEYSLLFSRLLCNSRL